MKGIKRILSVLLAVTMMAGLLPADILAAEVSDPGYAEITDGYLSVKVSKKNGGFLIDTVEGNQLKKSDDNKFLLYPDEKFDTSYTSFRVTRGGVVKDYIFGRNYGFLGADSSEVTVSTSENSITAVWSVYDLTFTQTLALLDISANQHGMAFITYQVENAGAEAEIQARVLMDTALGYQDYAVYELTQSTGEYYTVKHEQIVDGTGYVSSFFGYDSEYTPSVMAYNVNATVDDKPVVPTKVAFGHWNNLASTVFAFEPNESLYFTNQQNDYLTADSAYAMYFDMGTAEKGGKGDAIGTYYGIYSNASVSLEDKVAINFEMPSALQLNDRADAYVSLVSAGGVGTFGMNIKVNNISSENIETLAIAVYPEEGLMSYNTSGAQNSTATYSDPYYITVEDLAPGEERQVTIPFAAEPRQETQYRKIAVRCFDIHGTNLHLLEEKVLGERDSYILCPGAVGNALSFTSATPETIFTSGTRSLYLTGTNFQLLRDQTTYDVRLRSTAGRPDVVVPTEKVFIDTQANTAELVLDQELAEGTWQVVFDWKDTTKLDASGEALRFSVSDNPTFKNTTYGVLAVEKTSEMPNEFQLYAYETEEDYQAAFANTDPMELNLMEFRGSFSLTYGSDGTTIVGAKATAVEGGDSINISDCLDVDNGTLEITVEDPGTEEQAILVDIDGEVYTTGARTKVWNGVCALSAIENGCLLSKYNNIGKHLNTTADTAEANANKIMLWWPGAASGAQTLAGMVMEFRYAEFGRMYTEYGGGDIPTGDSKYVIAFGAEVSPDFLVPNTYVYDKVDEKMSQASYEQAALAGIPYRPFEIRDVNERHRAEIQKIKDSSSGSLSLAVHDILFGGGFIGFNTTVDVSLPSYMQGMPGLEGSLNLKVMGSEWAMNVSGRADFVVFEMEGELGLRSYNSIPVPDKLYFFLGGVTPGVNIDGMGIFWIRGAGGGVDKIYDTIFTASVLPPLTLMLTGEVALFATLSARGDLALSARGFSAGISDLKAAEITLVDYMGTEVYWYPRIKFGASIQVSILDIIYGNGSLLLQELESGEFFWEGFVNAGVQVPGWVPALGGMNIGSVDLGVNQERLWGAIHVLKLDAGVTYYWGGDVEFALGKYDTPEPTIQTFALFSAPVYTDETSGDTLYLSLMADVAGLTETVVTYNSTKKQATFTLADAQAGREDALVMVQFPASTLKEAKSVFSVSCGEGGAYPLVWMDAAKAADDPANANANASMTFDAKTRTASVTFSVTDAHLFFGKEMCVTTPGAAELSIYGMPRLPELESISVNDTTAAVAGDLSALSGLTVYADNGNGENYVLYEGNAEALAQVNNGEIALSYPANMPSGIYTIRAVGTTVDRTSNPIAEQEGVAYTNPNAPRTPGNIDATLGGDYTIDVAVTAPGGDFEGYLVTIYDENGEPTIYRDMQMDKASDLLTVGGQYTTTTEAYTEEDSSKPMVEAKTLTYGLEAGEAYTVGVRSFKTMADGSLLPSDEVKSSPVTMAAAQKPEVTLSAAGKKTVDGMDYVSSADVTIQVTADAALQNCTYALDDGDFAAWSGSGNIALNGLEDGGHKVTLRGENRQGDGFESMYVFTVRTAEPVLMLASPSAGSFYDDSITVSGMTDPNATVHMQLDDSTVTVTAGADGRFTRTLSTNRSVACQDLTVWAEDFLGTAGRKITMSLTNRLLGQSNLRPVLVLDGQEVESVTAEDNGKQLELAFKAGNHLIRVNPDSAMGSRIVWDMKVINGTPSVSEEGVLSGITDTAYGMVSGQLELCTAGAVIGAQRQLLVQNLVMEKTLIKNFGDPSFALAATGAAAGSTVTYVSSNPSVAIVDAATGMVTIIGAGVARITAIASATGDYQQTSVSCELTVNAVAQNLTFAQSTITKTEGAAAFTQTVSGAVTDVTYSSDNTAVAEVDSTTGEVTIKGVGTATITATAKAEGNFAEGTASYTLTVNAKGAQNISFGVDKVEKTYGDQPFALTVTGAAGKVTYTSGDPSVATVDENGKVTIHKAGTVTITASAAATAEQAAGSASCVVEIRKASQNLTFAQSAITKIEGAAAFTQTVSGAETTVTYTSSNTAVATVDQNGKVTIHGIGTATITAAAAEGDNYLSAEASYALTVNGKGAQNLSFGADKVEKTYGDQPFALTVTGAAGKVTYTSGDPSVATVDENGKVTIHKAGTVTITASAAATAEQAAGSASCVVEIRKASQNLTFAQSAITKIEGAAAFTQAVSGAVTDVTYSSDNTAVAEVDSATGEVTIKGVGTATITAAAAETANYLSAETSYVLTVNGKSSQPLSFGTSEIVVAKDQKTIALVVAGAADGSTITYTSGDPSVASVDENGLVTIHKPGTVMITACASAVGTYAETTVSVMLTVKTSQVITPVRPAPDQDEDEQPEQDDSCDGTVADNCPAVVFADVNTAMWYHKAVDYVLMNGIMSGMGGNTFQPNGNLSRAMMVQILYNMEGKPAVVGQSTFEDVSDGDWYHDAIVWANANGIVNGLSHTAFGPNGNITREQMVAILYRYAQYKGLDISARTPLTAYADDEKISAWAKENVAWGVAVGLISGTGNNKLDPNGNATRAQIAQVMMNFCEVVAK